MICSTLVVILLANEVVRGTSKVPVGKVEEPRPMRAYPVLRIVPFVMVRSPSTCKTELGAVVLMPTFPEVV